MPARRSPTRCPSSSNGWHGQRRSAAGRAPEDPPDAAPGEAHAVTQIAATEAASSDALERDCRVLTSVNPLRDAQARRDRAADAAATNGRRPQPVLAYQRYGRGKALAFTVQDSWLWQMHAVDARSRT